MKEALLEAKDGICGHNKTPYHLRADNGDKPFTLAPRILIAVLIRYNVLVMHSISQQKRHRYSLAFDDLRFDIDEILH